MNRQSLSPSHFAPASGIFGAGLLLALLLLFATPAASAQSYAGDSSDIDVLAQGPIHEAFAEPTDFNPSRGLVVTARPPEPIAEIPPDERPAGDDVIWIQGYWAWDPSADDYVWVSGIWRVPPPGRTWVPGYWRAVEGGWTWISGFWMTNETREITYLPAPPATLENGPSSLPPTPDSLWSPGSWQWTGTGYAWQPGHWVIARPEQVWVPAHYIWTPRGCVYIAGYWDCALERRGVLFAPIRLRRPVVVSTTVVYSPSVVIAVDSLDSDLFISWSSRHYYFGNYYGVVDVRYGIVPWFAPVPRYRCYDPIYLHRRWLHERRDPRWDDDLRSHYTWRVQHPDQRPPRDYRDYVNWRDRNDRDRGPRIMPLRDYDRRGDDSTRLVRVENGRRDDFARNTQRQNDYRSERKNWEDSPRSSDRGAENFRWSDDRMAGSASAGSSRSSDRGQLIVRPGLPGQGSVGSSDRSRSDRSTNDRSSTDRGASDRETRTRPGNATSDRGRADLRGPAADSGTGRRATGIDGRDTTPAPTPRPDTSSGERRRQSSRDEQRSSGRPERAPASSTDRGGSSGGGRSNGGGGGGGIDAR